MGRDVRTSRRPPLFLKPYLLLTSAEPRHDFNTDSGLAIPITKKTHKSIRESHIELILTLQPAGLRTRHPGTAALHPAQPISFAQRGR
jgi:hypothetical protein